MKKLIIAITTVLMLASAPAMAQVFLDDDDFDNRSNINEEAFGAMVPSQNVEIDQYVPVGGGILLLAGLAGAYLVGKRRKEE